MLLNDCRKKLHEKDELITKTISHHSGSATRTGVEKYAYMQGSPQAK